jgi:DNA-nicking Smr family endonuclease
MSDSDSDVFREAMAGTQTFHQDKVSPAPKKLDPNKALLREHAEVGNHPESVLPFSVEKDLDPVQAETQLSFARNGVQPRVLKRLKQGYFPLEASLDLHGFTVAEAAQCLHEFVAQARAEHVRCVEVVHGKGFGGRSAAPMLKNKVNSWLQQMPEVLAFTSREQRFGGAGALAVLLRA